MAQPKPKIEAHSTSPKSLCVVSWFYWIMLTVAVGSLGLLLHSHLKSVCITLISTLECRFGFSATEACKIIRSLGLRGGELYSEITKVDFILAPIVRTSSNALPALRLKGT